MDKKYVCGACGYEQDEMDRPCDSCGSIRVVLIKVIEDLLGSDWRKYFGKD